MCNLINTHTHTHTLTTTTTTHTPWEDQCEWHRITGMTGPDCAVMCNLVNTHTHTHTHRHRFLPALAEIVPSVVPYASNLYAREPPKLLFVLDGGGLEVVESVLGVQQGCNLGPLCYSAGSLKVLKEFRANPPVPGARAVSFIDDITVILPPELFFRYGRDRESYGMAAGMPGDRRHLAEPNEIAGPARRWSWARTTDGRAASDNGYNRAHGGPTGDEDCGSTSWNRTVSARFLTGGG